ncbi:hypothetical protein SK128_004805, partial [Halocaridina rubra]
PPSSTYQLYLHPCGAMDTRTRKNLRTFLLFCLWVLIELTGSSALKVRYGPTNCAVSGVTTTFTSAQEPSLPANTAVVPAPSDVICAIRANRWMATAFTFEEGNCTLYGPEELVEMQQILFGPPSFPNVTELEEVAEQKDTYASPKYGSYDKLKAVDGIATGDVSLFWSTPSAANPWWIVDIGEERTVYQIHIFPRRACCFSYFHNIE